MDRSAGLRPGALVSGRRIEPGRRPALQSRGSWAVGRSQRNKRLLRNRETPTVQSERGLSQTAARMLARALNLPRRMAWRSAAS
jgi:hypothetical protein